MNKKEENGKKFHQADYDAFSTGCSFIYMINIFREKNIEENLNKLNCYHGLYSCYDLNNLDKEKNYLNNPSDVYILIFNEKIYENNEIATKIFNEVINSNYINCKIIAKKIVGAYIVFINSENKNNFIEMCDKLKDYFGI